MAKCPPPDSTDTTPTDTSQDTVPQYHIVTVVPLSHRTYSYPFWALARFENTQFPSRTNQWCDPHKLCLWVSSHSRDLVCIPQNINIIVSTKIIDFGLSLLVGYGHTLILMLKMIFVFLEKSALVDIWSNPSSFDGSCESNSTLMYQWWRVWM